MALLKRHPGAYGESIIPGTTIMALEEKAPGSIQTNEPPR